MGKAYGQIAQFGFKKEAVRGTPEVSADFWVPTTDRSIDEKKTFVLNNQSYGVLEDSFGQDLSQQWVEGQIIAPITDKHFGLLLLNLLGSVNTVANADVGGLVKDHTFSVLQGAQHPSLTMFLDDPAGGQDYKFGLGTLETLDINYTQGKYVEYTAKFKSKIGGTATLVPATITENRFTHKHVIFKVAANLAGLTGAAAMVIKDFKLSFKKGIEDDYVLGSTDPVDFLVKSFVIDGQFTAFWQNETDYKTTFMANTPKAFRLDLLNSDVTIGTAARPELVIDLSQVYLQALTRAFKTGNIITQTLTFKATYSATDTKMITAKLTNLQTAY